MNQDHDMLTLEELEALAQAYIDCRLTRLEEKELELVLMSSGFSTPLIDEARETMGLTTAVAQVPRPKEVKARPRLLWLRISVAAACLALAVVTGYRLGRSGVGEETAEVIVYVDGQRLSPDLAEVEAMKTQVMCMAMMEETVNTAMALQSEGEDLFNSNN